MWIKRRRKKNLMMSMMTKIIFETYDAGYRFSGSHGAPAAG